MSTDALREAIRLEELRVALEYFPPTGRVLEIGAGSGWQADAMAQRGYVVTAVDLPGGAYAGSEVFPVGKYDGQTLPFPDASFDVVFSSNVLEHVPQIEKFLREMARVLAPGGVAVHVMPSASWRLWTCGTHYAYGLRVVWSLLRGRSGTGDLFFERNLAALSGSNRAARAWRRLLPQRHGEFGNALSEIVLFSRFRWRRLLHRTGWRVDVVRPVGLFYTGYFALGSRLSSPVRRRLAFMLGSSGLIYVAGPRSTRPSLER